MTDLWPQLRDYAASQIDMAHRAMEGGLPHEQYCIAVGGIRALRDLFKEAEQIARPAPVVDDPRDIPDGFGS